MALGEVYNKTKQIATTAWNTIKSKFLNVENSSASPVTKEEWSQTTETDVFFEVPYHENETTASDLFPNFGQFSTESAMTADDSSTQLYWGVWLAVVLTTVVAVLLTWMVLTRRRTPCHGRARHQLPASSTDFKVRPTATPRLQLTPDVIPQHSTAHTATAMGPSRPECIELKSYLLPYLSGRKEKSHEGPARGNHGSDRGVSENSDPRGVMDESIVRSEQRNIQLRPPVPTPQPERLTDGIRENSLYANVADETNVYAVPRARTHEEMLSSSNREFVHVYELPPDFVNSELNPAPSTQCLFRNSP